MQIELYRARVLQEELRLCGGESGCVFGLVPGRVDESKPIGRNRIFAGRNSCPQRAIGRNRQSLENKIIQPGATEFPVTGGIRRRKRLGGLLNYYYQEAGAGQI